MQLFAIYPTDPDVKVQPTAIKVDERYAAVVAFSSTTAALKFIGDRGLDPDKYEVRELSLDEYRTRAASLEQAVSGLTVFIQVIG